jgi:hypothetical protein
MRTGGATHRIHAMSPSGSGTRVGAVVAALMLASPMVASPLEAQAEVRGVVYDSLRARGPLRDATVTVDGLVLSARTDRRGRFTLPSVPPGEWTVRVQTPWLDSIALSPMAQVMVEGTRRPAALRLAVPSVRSYERAVCGTDFTGEYGVLRGEVRDVEGALRPGIFVGAVWAEAVLRGNELTTQLLGAIDTTNASGAFTLCGVPRESNLLLRAGDDTLGTGEISVRLEGRAIARHDLVVGSRARTAAVSGRVVNQQGVPIAGAMVGVEGDSLLFVRAGDDGSFTFRAVPQRSAQVLVRSIGYTPQHVGLEPTSDEVLLPDVVLGPVPQELGEIRIVAEATTLGELEFRQRQRSGIGVFLDEYRLAQYPIISANALAGMSTRIRSSGGSRPRVLIRRGGDTCQPRFYLDGVDFGRTRDGFEEEDLLRQAKRIEVHEFWSMPARYADLEGCGVVLIWTR